MAEGEPTEPTQPSLWKVSLVRLLGFLLITIGFVGTGKSGGHGVQLYLGLVLMLLGFATLMIVPRILRRR